MMNRQYSHRYLRPSRARSGKRASGVGSTLCDDVQTAFERACIEQDFEVAEHLLRALEAIAHREMNQQALVRAYCVLTHDRGRR